MKKLALCAFLIFGSVAYAVSIDFKSFEAVEIGDLKTEASDDGSTVIHTIEFSGPSLNILAKLLPQVSDENGAVPGMHMINITNFGQKGVADDKATSIYFECNTVNAKNGTSCNITIIKGIIPG